jgi:hypothetical protein
METQIFDTTYRLLALLIGVLVGTAAVRSFRAARAAPGSVGAGNGMAVGAVALGILASLVAGFGLNEIRRATGDVVYQVGHFSVFYVGFGLAVSSSIRLASPGGRTRLAIWSVYALSVAYAAAQLWRSIPASGSEPMPQQVSFFVPPFVALALATGVLVGPALGSARASATARWLALAYPLFVAGFLRESTIEPSTGKPIIDLLLAFGPFTVGAACVLGAALMVGRREQSLLTDVP